MNALGRFVALSRFGKDPNAQFGCNAGPGPEDAQDGQVQCKALQDWNFPEWAPMASLPAFSAFSDYDAAPSGRVRLGLNIRGTRGARTPGRVLRYERYNDRPSYRLRSKAGAVVYVALDEIVKAFAPGVKTD